jgi:hypothetical protein
MRALCGEQRGTVCSQVIFFLLLSDVLLFHVHMLCIFAEINTSIIFISTVPKLAHYMSINFLTHNVPFVPRTG